MTRIQLEQSSPKLGVIEDNLEAHCRSIVEASEAGVRLLVFPELSLTGYLLKDLVPDVALPTRELVRRLQEGTEGVSEIEVVVGFAEDSPRHRFYNSAAVLRWDEEGRVEPVHVHRKIYLPTYGLFDEARYYSAGRVIRAFDSAYLGRCGVLICEDAWHASLPLLLSIDGPRLEGAGVLVVVSNSPARGVGTDGEGAPASHRVWEDLLKTYSRLLEMVVIYANRGGVEDGLSFAGGSHVLAAGGEPLASLPLFESGLLEVDLDWPEVVRGYRIRSPVSAAENIDLLQRELKRIVKKGVEED